MPEKTKPTLFERAAYIYIYIQTWRVSIYGENNEWDRKNMYIQTF